MKTRVFAVCVVVFLFCGITHAGLSDGLVAYYPFNGNANDESGNGNNGTINGATLTADRFGNPNSAYSFNGNGQYIEVQDSPSIRPSYITLNIWAYPKTTPRMILGKSTYSNATNEQYAITGGADIMIKRNSNCQVGQGWYSAINVDLPINSWSLITGTWDGSTLKTYINGVLKKSNTDVPSGGIDNCSGGTLRIGKWWSQDIAPFNGFIDDIRIYSRALSQAEIEQLYLEGQVCPDVAVKPYTFTSGAPAKAIEVNADFDTIYQQINTQNCQIQTLNSQLQALKAIVCKNEPAASVCQ
jgi:hypothetical protein